VIADKKNVDYKTLPGFPQSRVVEDNDPILKYFTWYWKHGDGWVDINDLIHKEMKADKKDKFSTWFDPALRLAPTYGSGGNLDMIGNWAYTYPDPIRVGMNADELINMAGGYDRKQKVFQMIQMIWYKSQTAPTAKKKDAVEDTSDPFVADHIPDSMFPTPSPAHIKEAFWANISRPVDMIGFHGLGCLVPGEPGAYIYTHPDTATTLAKLNKEITKPYGPMLKKLPNMRADVAFLESFTTQVFTGKGAYGWANGDVGAWWHACTYAGLQMDVIYEEAIKVKGLGQYKVLVLPECEVLSKSTFDKIVEFQKNGGIIIADKLLVPGIKPDILIPEVNPVLKDGKKYKTDNLAVADEIMKNLRQKYKPFAESSNKEVVLHARQNNDDQYIFAINDMREFGDYVGSYGMVMENGIPAKTDIKVKRTGVKVIDLLTGKEVPAQADGQYTKFSVALEPSDGKIFLLTKNLAEGITVKAPESVKRGGQINLEIAVNGADGKPMASLVPLQVEIADPGFRTAEATGYYAAVNGKAAIPFDVATNDRVGVWKITVTELVTGVKTVEYFTVK
ncbi:MAG: beta-galactosidase trimerization domain-containing protein, partial [Verrucomicrobia bacterium]|nr:beta-galactosidase trimerization domain-containing protein [Verrucomicrobiota bacterium]